MLPSVFTWCARRALRWCHRHVRVIGTLPSQGPVLLAVNHPNELVDICVVLAHLPRRIIFVANVSSAEQPLVRLAYDRMGVIPVHRVRDARKAKARGEDSAAANAKAFARIRDALQSDACVCVFPEGGVHRGPHLGPLRTGLARMALEARESGQVSGLQIVPVGLSYEAPTELRSRVLVEIGAPLDVDSWTHDRSRAAVPQLTRAIADGLWAVTRNAPDAPSQERLRAISELVGAGVVSPVDMMTVVPPELARGRAPDRSAAPTAAGAPEPLCLASKTWRAISDEVHQAGATGSLPHDSRLASLLQLHAELSRAVAPMSITRALAGFTRWRDDRPSAAGRPWRAFTGLLGLVLHAPGWLAASMLARFVATQRSEVIPRRIIPGLYLVGVWYVLLAVGTTLAMRALSWPLWAALAGAAALLLLLPALGDAAVAWRDEQLDRRAHERVQRALDALAVRGSRRDGVPV